MAENLHETGFPDTPIDGTENDLFGVGNYVNGLCSFIRSCKTPMTISIQGDWGSGKTSMMNMIQAQLKDTVIPIQFNTWQFSQFNMGNELALSMITVLLHGLHCSPESINQTVTEIRQATSTTFGERISGAVGAMRRKVGKAVKIGVPVAKAAVPVVSVVGGPVAGLAAAGVAAGGILISEAGSNDETKEEPKEETQQKEDHADKEDHVDDVKSEKDFAETIVGLKKEFQEKVNRALEQDKTKTRVVVFVDDLDRLEPSRAVELLEVLKLFLDCKNCVFILAVDYEVVTLGIRQKYGADVDPEKGRSFFDKIIQLPFKMPVDKYDISNYVKNMLEAQNLDVGDDLELYKDLIQKSIGYNPRSMKRLFNTFQLLNMIQLGEKNDDVQTAGEAEKKKGLRERVLFAIICAQIKYEKLYQYLTSGNIADPEDLEKLKDRDQARETIEKTMIDNRASQAEREKQVQRLTDFMKYFIQAIQMDNDASVSEEELENLKRVMKTSKLVSVGNTGDAGDTAGDTESKVEDAYRKKNKGYAKIIAERLKDLPEHGQKDTAVFGGKRTAGSVFEYTDALYRYQWQDSNEDLVTFECQFSRQTESTVVIRYSLVFNGKKPYEKYRKILGDNPLNLSKKPEWMKKTNVRYGAFYPVVHSMNVNDYYMLESIADHVRRLIGLVEEKIVKAGIVLVDG